MTVAIVSGIARPIASALSFAFSGSAQGVMDAYGKLGAWSPISLFASGEQGAWFDPSDLSTMFQDSSGTTPVTADGQPVGLILDKSKELVIGSELVDTANTAAGWAPYGSNTVTQDGDAVKITFVGGTDSQYGALLYFRQTGGLSSDLVTGKAYIITLEAKITGGSADLKFADSLSTIATPAIQQDAYATHTWKAYKAASDTYLVIDGNLSAGEIVWIKNISVKEITGNHASQATAASRPLKTSTGSADWTNYDAVDDVLNTTFPSSLGSSCTVCRANVGGAPTILTGQTIGTSYADSTDNAGLIIINRALTGQETTDVTAWLTAKGATS